MFNNFINRYISKNRKIIVSLIICLVIGIISGVIIYVFLNSESKEVIMETMTSSLNVSKTDNYVRINLIINAVKNSAIFIFLASIFSIMLFGSTLIYLLYILKGISIGIYICVLFNIFGIWWGLLVVLLLVVLVNAVYIPAIIGIGIVLIGYNQNLFGGRVDINNSQKLSTIAIKLVLYCIIVFSSIILEQLMGNIVIQIYSKI